MSVTYASSPRSSRPPTNPLPSGYLQLRLRMVVDGELVMGVSSLTLNMNSFMAADTFSATIQTYLDEKRPLAWWCDQDEIEVEIHYGFATEYGKAPSNWMVMLVGDVDDVVPDLMNGTVRIKGRDLTARLIEASLQESYPNVRASELAKRFAQEQGLLFDVVDSPNLAGANYERNRNTGTLSTFSRAATQWDLLVHHAMREGYDVWVEGRTLHYKPKVDPKPEDGWEIYFTPPSTISEGISGNAAASPVHLNAHSLRMVRHMNLAKDIEVTVQSRNTATGQNIIATARGDRVRTDEERRRGRRERRGLRISPSSPLYGIQDSGGGRSSSSPLAPLLNQRDEARGPAPRPTRAPARASGEVKRYTFTIPGISSQDEAIRIAQSKLEELSKFEREISFEIRSAAICLPRFMVRLFGTRTSFDQPYFVHENELSYTNEGLVQRITAKNTSPRDEVKNSVQGSEGGSEVQARSRSSAPRPQPQQPPVRLQAGLSPVDPDAIRRIEWRPPPAPTRPDQ